MEDLTIGLENAFKDFAYPNVGHRPTPRHNKAISRGFTKPKFNFKHAKMRRKMEKRSQRINRRKRN